MSVFKKFLKRTFRRLARPLVNEIEMEFGTRMGHNESVSQHLLAQQYRLLASSSASLLPRLQDVGFRKYSEFEEDGILLYIFALVPPLNRKCVEICAGNGRECMSTNLIINHGWWGFLFDGNERNVRDGNRFFANHKDTFLAPPRFTAAWVTAENVNELLERAGAVGPVDLLSLDIDGMDYWVWKAMAVIQPQVVVCEIHSQIPPDQALTVPYDPKFVYQSEDFRGASLAAMCKLGRDKGYRLIGTHRFGFNAFFMLKGVGETFFPEVDLATCLNDPVSQSLRRERWPRTREMAWQEV